MDFEIVDLLVILDREMLPLSSSSLLKIMDFFEIVDDLLLTAILLYQGFTVLSKVKI